MRACQCAISFFLFVFFFNMTVFGQTDKSFDSIWEETSKEKETEWHLQEGESKRVDAEFERLWQERKAEIEKKWDEALRSTKKEWVDYSPSFDARSYVNFEEGFVEVAAILSTTEKDLVFRSEELIGNQIRKILSRDNPVAENILADQLEFEPGQTVTPSTVPQFVDETKSKTVIEKKPFVPKDGIPRVKAKVRFYLLPNHLQIRAKKYFSLVDEYSKKFRVLPELVLAIIHTESYFNPLAISPANAHGLMQLVPEYGAKDAYRMVYGKDLIVAPNYLYVPRNNIELGCAYLSLLKDISFSLIQDEIKRRYLVVCAYNWGPGVVTRRIVNRNDVEGMARSDLYQVLRRNTPDETSNYLKRVTERMKIYEKIFR